MDGLGGEGVGEWVSRGREGMGELGSEEGRGERHGGIANSLDLVFLVINVNTY